MASNIIDAKSVLLENKTECSTMSLDVKLDLNCLFPLSEAIYEEITPTKKEINEYINHEYNLLIDELALESSLEKIIEKYIIIQLQLIHHVFQLLKQILSED